MACPFAIADLMVPLSRAGGATFRSRLAGGHRASSLTPLFMITKNIIVETAPGVKKFPSNRKTPS